MRNTIPFLNNITIEQSYMSTTEDNLANERRNRNINNNAHETFKD